MSYKNYFELETPSYGGLNNAVQFSLIPKEQSPRLENAYMDQIGDISKRPGSVPVTLTAVEPIKHLTLNPFTNKARVGIKPVMMGVYDAASTIPVATYYARYTYLTADGETEASPETFFTIKAALANPTGAPTLSQTVVAGETLPDGTYYVAYTWKNEVGETLVSPERSFTVTAGNRLNISFPARPFGATLTRVYVGTVSGTLYFQSEVTGTSMLISTPIATATLAPTVNTTKAALRVVIPSFPLHVTGAKVYISTTTNTEKLQGSVTTTVYDHNAVLAAGAAYPTTNTASLTHEVLATAGNTLYSFYDDELHAATMTNTLKSADIYDVPFTSAALTNRIVIADGGNLKEYDGGIVKDIVPATNDPSPAPANVLTNVNTKGCKYIWTHTDHVFISPGTNEIFYTKRYEYNYVPEVQFFLLVRNGDHVTGPGIPFDNVCFVPMRRGWNIITGKNFDDFDASNYLNTINGVISGRSIEKITYATGTQAIAYLSDDGVNEIYTTVLDGGGRQYATRNLMQDKINFNAFGFTDDEKAAAISKYISSYSMYLLEISRGTETYVFGFDTRNQEWYLWKNLQINSLIEFEGVCYFAGDDGVLKIFDKELYTDWNDKDKTVGTPVYWKRYGPAESGEFSGFPSMWDAFLVESKQWLVPATLDITFIFADITDVMASIIRNEVFVEGISQWGFAKYANLNFTDTVNEPNEIIFEYSRLSKYVQVLMENNRDEPVKLFKQKWKGRTSGK